MKPTGLVAYAPSPADYRAFIARVFGLEPLADDGLRCVYLPSFSQEVALTLSGRTLTVATLTRSAWEHLCFRAGTTWLDPVHAVEPAPVLEKIELAVSDAAALTELVPVEITPRTSGLDGMTVELSWLRDGANGNVSIWVSNETFASRCARRLLECALRHVTFDASREALERLLIYF